MLGSLAAVVYRTAMDQALPPGLSAQALDAARSTVGGAMALASQWPAPAGPAMAAAARDAYVQGVRLCAGLSAVIMLVTAVVAFVTLRQKDNGGASTRT